MLPRTLPIIQLSHKLEPMHSRSRYFAVAIAAAIGYLALTLAVFSGVFGGGVLARRDLMSACYPVRWLSARLWASGELPLWNSASSCGYPLLADPGSAAFDPFQWLFLLPIDLYLAGTCYSILKYSLAGFFMYRYLRITGHAWSTAFPGGGVFLLSGVSIGSWTVLRWPASLMFLPLALAAVHARGTPAGRGIAAAAAFSLSLFSGAVEATLFTIVLWMYESIRIRRGFFEIGVGITGFVAFSLFQFLTALEITSLSSRSSGLTLDEALSYSVSPIQFIGLVSPVTFVPPDGGASTPGLFSFHSPLFYGTYVGAALLPLVFLGRPRGLLVIGVVAVLLSLGKYLPGMEELLRTLPVLGSLRYPVKFLWFLPPVCAILAADGLRRVSSDPAGRNACVLTSVIFVSVLALGTFLPDPFVPTAVQSAQWVDNFQALKSGVAHALCALTLAIILILKRPPFRSSALAALIILDLLIAGRRAVYFEPREIRDTPIFRSSMPEPWPRILSMARYDFRPGENPFWYGHQRLVLNSGLPHMVRNAHDYGSFQLPGLIHSITRDEWGDSRALAAAGISYCVADEELTLASMLASWPEAERIGRFRLLRNPMTIPEIRFYSGALRPDTARLRTPGENGIAGFIHDISGRATAQVIAESPGWIFRAESWYPGWHASLNGRTLTVVRSANHGQLVFVDQPGKLVFEFYSELFLTGLFAAAAAAALTASFLILRFVEQKS